MMRALIQKDLQILDFAVNCLMLDMGLGDERGTELVGGKVGA